MNNFASFTISHTNASANVEALLKCVTIFSIMINLSLEMQYHNKVDGKIQTRNPLSRRHVGHEEEDGDKEIRPRASKLSKVMEN